MYVPYNIIQSTKVDYDGRTSYVNNVVVNRKDCYYDTEPDLIATAEFLVSGSYR